MIISISGKAGAGKDLVAEIIQSIYPRSDFKIKKFAGKLKVIAAELLDVPVENFEDQEFKKQLLPLNWRNDKHATYREFLRYLGTDLFRDKYDSDVWVKSLLNSYTHKDNWIISDVRFLNEINSVKVAGKKDTLFIYVDRLLPDDNSHISETTIQKNTIKWDIVINNYGSIEDLKQQVKNQVKEFIYCR